MVAAKCHMDYLSFQCNLQGLDSLPAFIFLFTFHSFSSGSWVSFHLCSKASLFIYSMLLCNLVLVLFSYWHILLVGSIAVPFLWNAVCIILSFFVCTLAFDCLQLIRTLNTCNTRVTCSRPLDFHHVTNPFGSNWTGQVVQLSSKEVLPWSRSSTKVLPVYYLGIALISLSTNPILVWLPWCRERWINECAFCAWLPCAYLSPRAILDSRLVGPDLFFRVCF